MRPERGLLVARLDAGTPPSGKSVLVAVKGSAESEAATRIKRIDPGLI